MDRNGNNPSGRQPLAHGDTCGQRFRDDQRRLAESRTAEVTRQRELSALVAAQAEDRAADNRIYDLSDAEAAAESSPDWAVKIHERR